MTPVLSIYTYHRNCSRINNPSKRHTNFGKIQELLTSRDVPRYLWRYLNVGSIHVIINVYILDTYFCVEI
jgi:hypothetical protein